MMTTSIAMMALAATFLLPAGTLGQVGLDQEARTALAMILQGTASPATAVLTQEQGQRSPAELAAFADRLVSIATTYRTGDPPADRRAAQTASLAVLLAGHPGHLAERREALSGQGLAGPIPYSRSFEILERIAEGTVESGLSGAVLYFVSQHPQRSRALALLERSAVSQGRGRASNAIWYLATEMGDEGLVTLRRLYQSDGVSDPVARQRLAALASKYGW